MSGPAPTGAGPTPIEEIAAAVRACPAVVDLHGGAFGTVATYLPGRQVPGVRAVDEPGTDVPRLIEVHVAGRYPHPVREMADQVRAAVWSVLPGVEVAVTVEDYR